MQNILEITSVATVFAMVVVLIVLWQQTPDIVPLHYNFAGEADRWGSKAEMLVCPIIGVLLYTGLTVISRVPKIWNMAVEPGEENREALYSSTKSMLLWLKLEVCLIFLYLTWTGMGTANLSPWFAPLAMGAVFGTLAFYIWKQVKIGRDTRRIITIDSEVTRLKKTFPVSKYWLIVPCALVLTAFLSAAIGDGHRGLLFALLICAEVVPFCVMYGFAAREKSKYFSDDADINMALNRIRIREWTRFWVLAAYSAGINGIICYTILQLHQFTITVPVVVIYALHAALVLILCGLARSKIAKTTQLLLKK